MAKINKNDIQFVKDILEVVEKNSKNFSKKLKEDKPNAVALTTIIPEKGLRKFNI